VDLAGPEGHGRWNKSVYGYSGTEAFLLSLLNRALKKLLEIFGSKLISKVEVKPKTSTAPKLLIKTCLNQTQKNPKKKERKYT
jgi:hypothetical protein